MRIGAVLDLAQGKTSEQIVVNSFFDQGAISQADQYTVNDTLAIRFLGMNIDMENKGSVVILGLSNPSVPQMSSVESLVVEASVKPFISLVWIGSFLALAGAAIAIMRRKIELETQPMKDQVRKKKGATEALNAS